MINITGRKLISEGHTRVEKFSFEMHKEGKITRQERELVDHGNAVAALLYNPDEKKILLTRQFRLPAYMNGTATGMLVEVCAGLVEEGEDPGETIKREIREETGYAVREVEKVYEAYSSAGVLTELIHLYLVPVSADMKEGSGGGLKEEGEDIDLLELDFEQAFNMLRNGAIRDAKTIILLQYLQLKKIF